MNLNLPWELSSSMWGLAFFAAFLAGLSKTGFGGLSMITVLIMAELFDVKSVGIVAVLLIAADLSVYPSFRKFASWKPALKLFVPALVGILVGYGLLTWLLQKSDIQGVRIIIGAIVLAFSAVQLVKMVRADFLTKLPQSKAFLVACAFSSGVATTLANAGGGMIALYLLAKGIGKNEYLGICVRFFILVNLIKVLPLMSLGMFDIDTLKISGMLLPALFVGVAIGKNLISKVPQRGFEIMVLVFTILGAVRLIGK